MVALSFLRFCPVGGSILSLDRRLGGCQAVLLAEKFSARIGGEVPLIRALRKLFGCGLTATQAPVTVRSSPHRLGQNTPAGRHSPAVTTRPEVNSRPLPQARILLSLTPELITWMCLPRRNQIARGRLWVTIGLIQYNYQ
jgi:hypothetical protein